MPGLSMSSVKNNILFKSNMVPQFISSAFLVSVNFELIEIMSRHAIVFGASGITGWAVVNELLSDSEEARVFGRITALTNRPISVDQTFWPKSDKLNIVSGINLLHGTQEYLEGVLKGNIASIETVTHVYFNGK